MTAGLQLFDSFVTANTTITTTTETVAAVLSGVNMPGPGYSVKLLGQVQFTAGTSTTAYTLKIYRGADATGTLVGEGNPVTAGVAGAATCTASLDVTDSPAGELANQSYCVTVTQTGAAANGTILQADLRAWV